MFPPFQKVSDKIPDGPLRGQFGTYLPRAGLVHAANTALGLGMPLLLTGEPGCGKSDFAWAAARALGLAEPLMCQIRSDSRARDLLYQYDALVRFSDAQANSERARDPRNYIRLRPLGAALMTPVRRQVVRIDEIDKAPRDLPNDLLHELEQGEFEIPEIWEDTPQAPVFDRKYGEIALRREMKRPAGAPKPLVIITSNAERQLPEPFLRRCIFFHIDHPGEQQLAAIVAARFEQEPPEFHRLIADVFQGLRTHSAEFIKPPTIAEMLQWTTAITDLYARGDVQTALVRFQAALRRGGGRLTAATPSWSELPGLSCLLKHKEDLLQIGAHVGRPDPA